MRWLFVILLALVAACGDPPSAPEEQVREWLAAAQDAAEAKERRALVGMISPAYTDARGNERSDIENMLRVYFLRQHSVSLLSSVHEIRIVGSTAAEVEMTVGMAGTNDGVLGFSADAYDFELELESDGDEWLLISARWGELGDELH